MRILGTTAGIFKSLLSTIALVDVEPTVFRTARKVPGRRSGMQQGLQKNYFHKMWVRDILLGKRSRI
jgi:hypothetical protein